MTLREAEDQAQIWLETVQKALHPPAPKADESANAEDVEAEDDTENAEGEEEEPVCLRDCFVDDDWDPAGFKNPTEAMVWLTANANSSMKATSVDLAEEGASLTFEMGTRPIVLTARLVVVDGLPHCQSLKEEQAPAPEAANKTKTTTSAMAKPTRSPASAQ
ncbi:hypothetical protein LLH03_19740 [bacterium]|nr:hypothetical protein [bacterium]